MIKMMSREVVRSYRAGKVRYEDLLGEANENCSKRLNYLNNALRL
jgi:hypothetical protein